MKKSTPKKPSKAASAARAPSKKQPVSTKKLTISGLRTLNLVASFLLSAQAVALILLSDKNKGDVSLSASYLARDPIASDATGQVVLASAADHLASVNLVYPVAAFLLLAALASLLSATRMRARYEADLTSGTNKVRWISYILSLGVLLLTAGMIVGVRDKASLAMLLVLTAVACVLALNSERQRLLGDSGWLKRLALLVGLVPLAVIALYVLMSHIYGGGLPLKTLAAIGVLGMGLLASFVALKNLYKGNTKPAQYLAIERAYIVFGFLVSSLFAWAIFGLLLK